MSGQESHIVAILKPAPGKLQEFNTLLKGMCKNVHEKEEGTCLRYIMTEEVGTDDPNIIMIETYASKKDADEHGKTPWFNEFFNAATSRNLLSKDQAPKIMHSKSVSGFDLDHKFIH